MVALQEDGEDQLGEAEESCTPRTEHEKASVLEVMYARKTHLELPVLIAGVIADVGKHQGEQHERHNTKRNGHLGNTEDTQGDSVSHLIEEGTFPAERLGDRSIIMSSALLLLCLGDIFDIADLNVLALFGGLVHLGTSLAEQFKEVTVLP